LDTSKVDELVFLSEGVESIAICLLHAYKNPVHEKALSEFIKKNIQI
jgi:N-methylhydantoinase A/oxoprolinase/acetone carboxylase beta subunit